MLPQRNYKVRGKQDIEKITKNIETLIKCKGKMRKIGDKSIRMSSGLMK